MTFNQLSKDIKNTSNYFNEGTFCNSDVICNAYYYSADTIPYGNENSITLGGIVVPESTVSEKHYVDSDNRSTHLL